LRIGHGVIKPAAKKQTVAQETFATPRNVADVTPAQAVAPITENIPANQSLPIIPVAQPSQPTSVDLTPTVIVIDAPVAAPVEMTINTQAVQPQLGLPLPSQPQVQEAVAAQPSIPLPRT
jgi:hypothetical protein